MKRVILFTVLASIVTIVKAQQITDSFDTNSLGWTEISGKDGEALIVEGKMKMEGKKELVSFWHPNREPSWIETHCYAPIDVNKNFNIKCDTYLRKIDDNGFFGIMLDYIDEGNFICFMVQDEQAYLLRYRDYVLVGRMRRNVKFKDKKKADVKLEIKSTFNKMEFIIDGMTALDVRFIKLTSNGVGFVVYGKQKAEFDNFEIIQ